MLLVAVADPLRALVPMRLEVLAGFYLGYFASDLGTFLQACLHRVQVQEAKVAVQLVDVCLLGLWHV